MIALTLLLMSATAPLTDADIERHQDCLDLQRFLDQTNAQTCEDVRRTAFDPNTFSRAIWFRHNLTLFRRFFVSNQAPVFVAINHTRGEVIWNFRLAGSTAYRESPESPIIRLPIGTILTIAFDENDPGVVKWTSTTLRFTMGPIWRLA